MTLEGEMERSGPEGPRLAFITPTSCSHTYKKVFCFSEEYDGQSDHQLGMIINVAKD